MRRGRALPQRRARPYPAHKALYKSLTHIVMSSLYRAVKEAPRFPVLGRGGLPTPIFPLPNVTPKCKRGPMCVLQRREHRHLRKSRFYLGPGPSALMPSTLGTGPPMKRSKIVFLMRIRRPLRASSVLDSRFASSILHHPPAYLPSFQTFKQPCRLLIKSSRI